MKWKPWDMKFGGFWKAASSRSEVVARLRLPRRGPQGDNPFFMYIANAPRPAAVSRFVDRYPLESPSRRTF